MAKRSNIMNAGPWIVSGALVLLCALSTVAVAEVPVPPAPAGAKEKTPFLIDSFETGRNKNKLSNRADVYMKEPSKTLMTFPEDVIQEKKTHVLKVRYEKFNKSGPYDSGGWCGYYSLLKSPGALVAPTPDNPNPSPQQEQFFDASKYASVTFWVRGEKGDENFVVGVADFHWDRVGDAVKSEAIGKYLPEGKITTQWQKAVVPLDQFFVDLAQLASVSILFEGNLFPDTGHAGIIYVDDLSFE